MGRSLLHCFYMSLLFVLLGCGQAEAVLPTQIVRVPTETAVSTPSPTPTPNPTVIPTAIPTNTLIPSPTALPLLRIVGESAVLFADPQTDSQIRDLSEGSLVYALGRDTRGDWYAVQLIDRTEGWVKTADIAPENTQRFTEIPAVLDLPTPIAETTLTQPLPTNPPTATDQPLATNPPTATNQPPTANPPTATLPPPTIPQTPLPTNTPPPTLPLATLTPLPSATWVSPTNTPLPEPTLPPTVTPIPQPVFNSIGSLTSMTDGTTVLIRGRIVDTASFARGFKFTVNDGTGTVIVLLWHNVFDESWDKDKLNVGAEIEAEGEIGRFEGELQVSPAWGGGIKAVVPASPWAEKRTVSELRNHIDQRVMVEGQIITLDQTDQFMKLIINDGTGEVEILLWNNIWERVPNAASLTEGRQIRAVGVVGEFRGNIQLVPPLPHDVLGI